MTPEVKQFAQEFINEAVANMYHAVYLRVKANKLSSTGAKRMITDSLADIWAGKLYVSKDGKFYDLTKLDKQRVDELVEQYKLKEAW